MASHKTAQLVLTRAEDWEELDSTETLLCLPGPILCLPTGAALVGDNGDCRLKLLFLRPTHLSRALPAAGVLRHLLRDHGVLSIIYGPC